MRRGYVSRKSAKLTDQNLSDADDRIEVCEIVALEHAVDPTNFSGAPFERTASDLSTFPGVQEQRRRRCTVSQSGGDDA